MISRKGNVEIKCHKCGKNESFRVGGITITEDMHQIRIEGGHGDEFPQDMDVLAFDICGTCLKSWVDGFEHCGGNVRNWHNPLEEALDVPLADIVRLVSKYNDHPDPAANEARIWESLSMLDRLDAYVLPSPSGWHELGARYGDQPHQYVSFTADKGPDLEALLKKATRGGNPWSQPAHQGGITRDIIRELGVLHRCAHREKIDAFVEANRTEIISAAWDMSEVICKWHTLGAVFYHAQPRDKYGRSTVQPTPESEIRVFHAANGPKIVAAAERLMSLGPDTHSGFSAAIDIVVRDAINNIKEGS